MNLLYISYDNILCILDFIGNKHYIFSILNKEHLLLYKNKFKNTKTSRRQIYSNLNINILKYAHKNKLILKEKESMFSRDTRVIYNSEWYKPGKPYNRNNYIYINNNETICDIAAKQKQFDCLEYGLRSGCKFNTYKKEQAPKEIIEFIIKCINFYGNRIDISVKRFVDRSHEAIQTILNDDLDKFKIIIEDGYLLNSNVAAQAAAVTHVNKIEFLKCLRDNKYPIRDDALYYANWSIHRSIDPKKALELLMFVEKCQTEENKRLEKIKIIEEQKRQRILEHNYALMGFKYSL